MIEAALTGHLLLTTVHSGDPAETIVRFLEMGIAAYQLVSALTLVSSQRLLRKRCIECDPSARADCARCLGTGYAERVAVAQIACVNESLREIILNNPTTAQLRETLDTQGPDMHKRARDLVDHGVTDRNEVARVLGE